jgi:type II secretory pathway component PulM
MSFASSVFHLPCSFGSLSGTELELEKETHQVWFTPVPSSDIALFRTTPN